MPDGTTLLKRAGPAMVAPPSLEHAFGRVIAAATIATALEWYDFFLYAVVAPLVFDTLFFPKLNPLVGIIAVWGTFAAGFIARPLGGIFFGHFGDRLGRKWPVFQAVVTMGVASALIGCLPGYAAIGVAGPLLLLLLRFVQGFALGGESIGAALLAIEWAPTEKRGFYGAFPQASGPIGIICASLIVTPLSYFMGHGFIGWGWRIPFMASFVLMLVAAWLLLSVSDSMVFLRAKADEKVSKTPVTDVVRGYKKQWAIGTAIAAGSSAFSYLVTIFAMAYGARSLHMSTSVLTIAYLLSNILALFTMPAFGRISDKLGRRPLWGTGVVLAMAYITLFFAILGTRSPWLVIGAITLGAGIIHPLMFGPEGSIIPELFPTKVRFSGASLGKQIGTLLGGGLAPMLAQALLAWSKGAFWSVDVYYIVVGAIALTALYFARETSRTEL
ncbi:MAG TPA: MFS transporter [Acetobacteraceae bacterium]|nr:MFS transporter [Acetobacteraceae bacterium]